MLADADGLAGGRVRSCGGRVGDDQGVVADVVDGPVGGEPDGVEAVSQGGCLGGMISEPTPWPVLQGMDFARS